MTSMLQPLRQRRREQQTLQTCVDETGIPRVLQTGTVRELDLSPCTGRVDLREDGSGGSEGVERVGGGRDGRRERGSRGDLAGRNGR